ncbi:hypothetical protein ACOMHN_065759 [Nucella lapillus]
MPQVTQKPYPGQTQQAPGAGTAFSVFGHTGAQAHTQRPTQGAVYPGTPAVTQASGTNAPFRGVFWNTQRPSHTNVPPQTQATSVPVQTTPPVQLPQTKVPTARVPVHEHASDFYPSPFACDEYFICANQVSYRVHCAMGLHFNPVSKHCDWPRNVRCNNLTTTIVPATQPHQLHTQPPHQPHTIAPVIPTKQPVRQTQAPPLYTKVPSKQPTQPPSHTNAPGQSSSAKIFCAAAKSDGAYRHPTNCNVYFVCQAGTGTSEFCPNGLAFNPSFALCQDLYFIPACRPIIQG